MCVGKTLLLGDSNTSGFSWTKVGACDVVVAGVGGARIRLMADAAPFLARAIQPRIVHIMAGTNNCPLTPFDPEWGSMREDYNRLVDAFQVYPCKIVLWVPPPFTPAGEASGYTMTQRALVRSMVYQVQADQGGDAAGCYDEWWADTLIDPSTGYALPTMIQADGVHMTPAAQTLRYNRIAGWNTFFANAGWPCQ